MILEAQEEDSDSSSKTGNSSPQLQTYLCAGCSDKIMDRYYLMAVDKQWHIDCLRCSDCSEVLETQQSCFIREEQIFCRADYYKRFANQQCASCEQTILPSELVMRTKEAVYHVNCFVCGTCQVQLNPGDQYGSRDRQIFCSAHFKQFIIPSMLMEPTSVPQQENLDYFGARSTMKTRARKKRNQMHDDVQDNMCPPMNYHLSGDLSNLVTNDVFPGSTTQRQKRVRTSFKHHQLKAMKMYFQYNHNPDAKDLKQLAQKTGLSKRVLQVWFQNARAKYRRQDGGSRREPEIKEIQSSKDSVNPSDDDEERKISSPFSSPSPPPSFPTSSMDYSDFGEEIDFQTPSTDQLMVGLHPLLTPPDSSMDRAMIKSDDSYEDLFHIVG